jgi:DNA modification methylase
MARSEKELPGRLKKQLQSKSARRRKRNTARTRVVAAQSGSGRNDLQPDLKTVIRPIGSLRPSAKRARVTKPEQLERVINSIKQFGLVLPLLIDRQDYMISGHILWEASLKLGFEEIECRVVDHLSPIELEALTLALNRLGETGTYDLDMLRDRMIEIKSAGIELTATGFTIPEIDQIILNPEPQNGEEEEADEKIDNGPPTTRSGDLFQLGDHRLLCGDALDEASYHTVLAGQMADAVFSDPPYNCKIEGFVSGLGQHKHADFKMAVGELDDSAFLGFLCTYLAHCKAVTSSGAIIFACMDWRQIDILLAAGRDTGLTRKNIVIWDKGSGAMGSLYRSAYEMIAVFCNGKTPAINNVELGRHGRDRTNVWSYPGANRRGSSSASALADHPTPKPIELVEDALLDITAPGDVVLDPFMGSGTTLISADRCGRIACGIELDPIYVDRTIRRWERLTGRAAIHAETGLTFTELARQRSDDPGAE